MQYFTLKARYKYFNPEHRKGLDARAEDREHNRDPTEV